MHSEDFEEVKVAMREHVLIPSNRVMHSERQAEKNSAEMRLPVLIPSNRVMHSESPFYDVADFSHFFVLIPSNRVMHSEYTGRRLYDRLNIGLNPLESGHAFREQYCEMVKLWKQTS